MEASGSSKVGHSAFIIHGRKIASTMMRKPQFPLSVDHANLRAVTKGERLGEKASPGSCRGRWLAPHNCISHLTSAWLLPHHQPGIKELAFPPGLWSGLPGCQLESRLCPLQFALRSLKVVVKTNDKSQLTSWLPSDQPMREQGHRMPQSKSPGLGFWKQIVQLVKLLVFKL